jgi:hypothetical protein
MFFGPVPTQKTRLALAFFSLSNRNRGKAFAILSKKKLVIETRHFIHVLFRFIYNMT